MADTGTTIDPVEENEIRQMTREQAEEYLKRQQLGHRGDMIDSTLGGMGGAGASGSGPDIAKISDPQAGNSSDLPKRP
ncbi:hypothetical protein [Sphingomonas nostoxanthinifaciens]|uniref:hypothetical protein n=1 Tax=Sphingomonas nostoxanthinifaciens TaxID=2872652 RepID=UPI001CC20F3F|nr:hypothetical protein [Sphingomonas nostoxanthinifaciens]UAK23516.1 hypothetical protein K8P63_14110 [Sphingomonas nostoxanthinifaciens]